MLPIYQMKNSTRYVLESGILIISKFFCNRKHRHNYLGHVLPVDSERVFLEDSKRLLKCG